MRRATPCHSGVRAHAWSGSVRQLCRMHIRGALASCAAWPLRVMCWPVWWAGQLLWLHPAVGCGKLPHARLSPHPCLHASHPCCSGGHAQAQPGGGAAGVTAPGEAVQSRRRRRGGVARGARPGQPTGTGELGTSGGSRQLPPSPCPACSRTPALVPFLSPFFSTYKLQAAPTRQTPNVSLRTDCYVAASVPLFLLLALPSLTAAGCCDRRRCCNTQ